MGEVNIKLQIKNYKLSLLLDKEIAPRILRMRGGVRITVYKNARKLINITGIKSLNQLKKVKKKIEETEKDLNNNEIQLSYVLK